MERRIIETGDGSKTIQLVEWNEQYHSVHGALQEAKHVFINHLKDFLDKHWKENDKEIRIFEMGFGTGLNALLTAQFACVTQQKIHYTSLEAYPVSQDEIQALNYVNLLEDKDGTYERLHEVEWGVDREIHPYFCMYKQEGKLAEQPINGPFDLIFYDAFGPRVQPDLWTLSIFEKLFASLNMGGALFTYCAKGEVRRAMISAGFEVSRVPGPPGKREMLVARKL